MLYHIPIEPLEERYSAQWYHWFADEYRRQGVEFQYIDGQPLSTKIETGTFLDVNSTLAYKSTQLHEIAKLFYTKQIKDGDVFFVADVEFWGIESIRYLADLNGIKDVKIFGFAHAGSYTREDFFSKCEPYAWRYEQAWGSIFDCIFVGSEYHAQQLANLRGVLRARIEVTGNPYRVVEVAGSLPHLPQKQPLILCTNRPDPEKRPELTLAVFRQLMQQHPDWQFAVTTGRDRWGSGDLRRTAMEMAASEQFTIHDGLTKSEYFEILASAAVVTGNTIEENFGYCILEAMVFNTIPIVENKYSHPEVVGLDDRCLFDSTDVQIARIEQAIANPFDVRDYALRYEVSLPYIVKLCTR